MNRRVFLACFLALFGIRLKQRRVSVYLDLEAPLVNGKYQTYTVEHWINPYIDINEYHRQLRKLKPVDRYRLLYGG